MIICSLWFLVVGGISGVLEQGRADKSLTRLCDWVRTKLQLLWSVPCLQWSVFILSDACGEQRLNKGTMLSDPTEELL